ncbi:MAG: HXXEE domain-containing protein [Pedobacter sp.]|nr:MAG: HXXEE domain-containing protein [Pedobacter sp.]
MIWAVMKFWQSRYRNNLSLFYKDITPNILTDKMDLLRRNWYDFGAFLAIVVCIYVYVNHSNLTNYQILMWLSLVSLFFHQLEEYRIVGTFPGMVNAVMYKSKMPDRYPLNANTAFYVNVVIGWSFYFLAALFAERAVWLGIAAISVSIGNIVAHTVVFNIKGKSFYNAGLATCWLFFVPCVYFFISFIQAYDLATNTDYFIGIAPGIILNFFGILKLIDWMANKNTNHIFYNRNLLLKDR